MSGSTLQQSPDDEVDPYVEIFCALQSGVLLTVNESASEQAGIDQMEVTHVNERTGVVTLEGHGGERYRIIPEDRYYGAPAIKEISESEFHELHEPIETFEIIGIA